MPCKACGNRYYTKAQVIECFKRHLQPNLPAHPAMEEKSAVDVQEDPRYQREGAKYLCSRCGKYYFTKKLVISCYDQDGEDSRRSVESKKDDSVESSDLLGAKGSKC